MACERPDRRSRGIEIDPLSVDTVIRRWQKYTGRAAVCVAANTCISGIGSSAISDERRAFN